MTNAVQQAILIELSGHRGPERRISRQALLKALQKRVPTSDREMRASIESLRREHAHGAWICADLRGGYFMARDEQEIEDYLASDERRALRLLERVRLQRRAVQRQTQGQQGLFDG